MLDKKYDMYDISAAKQAKDTSFSKSANYFDQNKVDLMQFSAGQKVVIPHPKTGKWDQSGVIVGMRPDQLFYSVKCEDGHLCIRARRMLRKVQNEVNVITPLARSTSSFASANLPSSSCVYPRMHLQDQGPPRTLSRR